MHDPSATLEVVDEQGASLIVGLAPATLRCMRTRGGGPPFVRISGRCVRYVVADLRKYVADRTVQNTAQRSEAERAAKAEQAAASESNDAQSAKPKPKRKASRTGAKKGRRS